MESKQTVGMMLVGDRHVGLRLQFARELAILGIRVTIAVPTGTTIETGTPEIGVVRYPFEPKHPLRTAKALVQLRRSTNSDIVHAFSTGPAMVSSLAAWLDRSGIYVRTVNGLGRSFCTDGPKGTLMRALYTGSLIAVDHRVKCAVFQNNDDANWFGSVPILRNRRRQVILGSGVALQDFDDLTVPVDRVQKAQDFLGTNGRPTAVLVGRHMKTKGVDDLCKAAELASKMTDAPMLFAVVGPTETNAGLASVSSSGTYGTIEFKLCESWKDMPALFAASTVVVLPTTYREGIPRVLLEGAAMRRPLVAYDVPGCREIVVDGENGALLPPGNVDLLAKSLVRIINDTHEQTRMGNASRKLIEDTFDVRLIAAQYARLYRSL
jgi:glycosyltransferase involved in cell wall biosynthesis